MTWGDPDRGGDSSEVKDQLKGVQQVHAAKFAFVAILMDGSIVTWCGPSSRIDRSAIAAQVAIF